MPGDTNKLKEMLNPRDKAILDATSGTSWVPPNPVELLTPYVDPEPTLEQSEVEARRTKAKEVYDNYGKIIESCKELEDQIVERCKNVTITLNPQEHSPIMDAIKRVFGTDGTTITFQMYKRVVAEMAKSAKDNIPTPTGV